MIYDTSNYKKPIETALKSYNDSCNQLMSLAAAHRLHPDHVAHLQAQVQKRSKDLIKQLAFEHSDVEIALPEIPSK